MSEGANNCTVELVTGRMVHLAEYQSLVASWVADDALSGLVGRVQRFQLADPVGQFDHINIARAHVVAVWPLGGPKDPLRHLGLGQLHEASVPTTIARTDGLAVAGIEDR